LAALGESASILLTSSVPDGRIRLTVNLPAEAVSVARELGMGRGELAAGRRTVTIGWGKLFADGALGSHTAALFEPYTCGPAGTGISRLEGEELAEMIGTCRRAGISVAVHAIGDRGAATVLDALDRGPRPAPGTPPDRLEHLQLLRPADIPRFAAGDVTASIQPIHCASDRQLVDACWADRTALAYPWRALRDAGARLAMGSDAPIESPNPWQGIHAAVHRRLAGDGTPDWHPEQALTFAEALAGYTTGIAGAGGWPDRGRLTVGSVADLAVLNQPLSVLAGAGDELAQVRSELTLVDGEEVPLA
jgi:predicted amidohydrolase YtcJ